MTKKLTVKEQKLVQGVAMGKSQTQAAKDAGYGKGAHVTATKTLKKANVQQALQEALVKHGISLDKAIKPISEALDAEKVVIVGKGDDAFADVTPDHSVRLQASDRALKLMGVKTDSDTNVQVNFVQIADSQREKYGI